MEYFTRLNVREVFPPGSEAPLYSPSTIFAGRLEILVLVVKKDW